MWPNWTAGVLSLHNSPWSEWPGRHTSLPHSGQTHTHSDTCTHIRRRAWCGFTVLQFCLVSGAESRGMFPWQSPAGRGLGRLVTHTAVSIHLYMSGQWVFFTIIHTHCPTAVRLLQPRASTNKPWPYSRTSACRVWLDTIWPCNMVVSCLSGGVLSQISWCFQKMLLWNLQECST